MPAPFEALVDWPYSTGGARRGGGATPTHQLDVPTHSHTQRRASRSEWLSDYVDDYPRWREIITQVTRTPQCTADTVMQHSFLSADIYDFFEVLEWQSHGRGEARHRLRNTPSRWNSAEDVSANADGGPSRAGNRQLPQRATSCTVPFSMPHTANPAADSVRTSGAVVPDVHGTGQDRGTETGTIEERTPKSGVALPPQQYLRKDFNVRVLSLLLRCARRRAATDTQLLQPDLASAEDLQQIPTEGAGLLSDRRDSPPRVPAERDLISSVQDCAETVGHPSCLCYERMCVCV